METKTNPLMADSDSHRKKDQWIFNNRGRDVRAPSMLEVVLKVACCEGAGREGAFSAQPLLRAPCLTLKPLSSHGEQ